MLTSDCGPDEWLAMMSDALQGAAVDRFASTTHKPVIEGDSYCRRQRSAVDTSTDSRHHDLSAK